MLKNILVVVIGVIILVGVWGAWSAYQNGRVEGPADENGTATTSPILDDEPEKAEIPDLIVVDRPRIGEQISSPLTVLGEARGTWYFEASAPMYLEDAGGVQIAQGHVEAQGNWMTTDFVPFKGTLTFTAPASNTGTLVMMNDNPSGLPENQKELRIPVTFR